MGSHKLFACSANYVLTQSSYVYAFVVFLDITVIVLTNLVKRNR